MHQLILTPGKYQLVAYYKIICRENLEIKTQWPQVRNRFIQLEEEVLKNNLFGVEEISNQLDHILIKILTVRSTKADIRHLTHPIEKTIQ